MKVSESKLSTLPDPQLVVRPSKKSESSHKIEKNRKDTKIRELVENEDIQKDIKYKKEGEMKKEKRKTMGFVREWKNW